MSWGFFDGVSQDKGSICGAGGCLYITDDHFFLLKAGLGRGTNNHAELLALKFLLKLAMNQVITKMQVDGDSEVILYWVKGSYGMGNLIAHTISEQVKIIESMFSSICFLHRFRYLIHRQMSFQN
jgi:ribonuclease HI